MEIGLHRRVDEWDEFDSVQVESRKRTLWAIYSQQVKACCTFGRPLLLHLRDIGEFSSSYSNPKSTLKKLIL